MITTTTTAERLTYEETILLQEIMMYLDDHGIPFEYDVDIFESLHRKIIEY